MDAKEAAKFIENAIDNGARGPAPEIARAFRIIMRDPQYAYITLDRSALALQQQGGEEIVHTALVTTSKSPEHARIVLIYPELLKNKPYKRGILLDAFHSTINSKNPNNALYNLDQIEGWPEYNSILKSAMVICVKKGIAEEALHYTELLEGKPFKESMLAYVTQHAAGEEDAYYVLHYSDEIQGRPYYDATIQKALETTAKNKNAIEAINYEVLAQQKPYHDSMLKTAFERVAKQYNAYQLLSAPKLGLLMAQPYGEAVLKTAFETTASEANRSTHVIDQKKLLLTKPYGEATLKTAFEITAKGPYSHEVLNETAFLKTKPYGEAVIQSAFENLIPGCSTRTFADVVPLLRTKPYAEKLISDYTSNKINALYLAQTINENHEQPDAQRFAILKHLRAPQEFDIITHGRAEVYTSTYRGVLDDLIADLKQEKKPLTAVLTPDQMTRMDVFLEVATSYNRLDDVLGVIPPNKLPAIIKQMVARVGDSSDLSYSQTLVTMMLALKNQPTLRHQLEADVKTHFEQAKTPEAKDKYGFIASAYGRNCPNISADMKPYFIGMANNPDYEMPKMGNLDQRSLVDKKGVCNQLMVFSHDADSKNSFKNFLGTYKNKPDWKTIDHKEYVEIVGSGGKVPIHIFANKPEHDEQGLTAINQALAKRQGRSEPSFQMFIGRGHSYHASTYLPMINEHMKLVHLGSCGGFQNLSTVYKQSPDAQVIATQKTGSMFVNDPLLFAINDSIMKTGSVDWKKQQLTLNNIGSEHKDAYLLPNKNIPAMMQQAYYSVDDRREKLTLAKVLDDHIKDRAKFTLLWSDGVISKSELDDIMTAAKEAGKDIKVVQNKGDADQIILSDDKWKVTYKVKLTDGIKSQSRER